MKFILICLLSLTVVNVGKGQEKLLDISGNLKLDHYNTFKKFKGPIVSERNQGLFQLDLSKSMGKTTFFSSFEFREDFSNSYRNRVFPKAYYVDLHLKKADFRFGKQKYVWGRADGINPTNNLSPIDYSDYLDTYNEEIGQLSLNGKFYKKDWIFQGIYIPVFTSSILPQSNTIWKIPFPETVPNPYVPDAYFKAIYNVLPASSPARDISSGQYALKIDGRKDALDYSISFTSGNYNLPEFVTEPKIYNMDTILISVTPVFVPRDILGFDFASAIGKIGIRGEAAYFAPKGEAAKKVNYNDNYIRYVLGADFRKSMENTNFFIIAQWMQEIVPSGFEYSSISLNHLFQKAIMTRLEIDFRNIFTLSFQALYDIKDNDYYLQPKVNYKISDGLELMVLADILEGDDKSLFGLYRNNDRIQLKIKYSF